MWMDYPTFCSKNDSSTPAENYLNVDKC